MPKDNTLRQFNELVDFTFIYEELEAKNCLDNGRNVIDPKEKKVVGTNQTDTYFFDIEKCKRCTLREDCYKEGAKMAFQETEYFKMKAKERYKIEAKNRELKHGHGYDVATSSGLLGMQLQGAMAIFAVNLKRILKLVD